MRGSPAKQVFTIQRAMRTLLGLAALLSLPVTGRAQTPSSTPVPKTPVQIENTNASFVPTDVNIPQANPARPTVTIPAHIPPTGYLQFEQGFNRAGDSPAGVSGQTSLSQTTKIAVVTRLMLQFITQPYAYSSVAAPDGTTVNSSDPGDLIFGVQGILYKAVGAFPTVDIGYLRRVRTGSSANLDSGNYSQSAMVLLGGDLPGSFHYDSNLLFNEQNSGPVRRPQFGQTLAVSHPLFPKATHNNLGSIVEISHFTQPFLSSSSSAGPTTRGNTADLLFAATYSVRPNLILDAAFSHGFTSSSTQWQGIFGISYLLPRRLWPDRNPRVIPVGSHQ